MKSYNSLRLYHTNCNCETITADTSNPTKIWFLHEAVSQVTSEMSNFYYLLITSGVQEIEFQKNEVLGDQM
jgi:hypothetical protein